MECSVPDAELCDENGVLDVELTMADRSDHRTAAEHQHLRQMRERANVVRIDARQQESCEEHDNSYRP